MPHAARVRHAVGMDRPPTEITAVWIDTGCILCSHCVGACAEVFALGDDEAVVIGEVRTDGRTSSNRDERAPLDATGREHQEGIRDAMQACPVAIIHVSTAS